MGDVLGVSGDDEVYSAVLELCRRKGLERPDVRIEYFVIDGFRRLAAASEAFSSDLDSWKGVPTIPSIVIRGRRGVSMDVLSAAFLSLMLNMSGALDLVERLPFNLRDGIRQLAKVLGIQLDWL
jgi:precorrin-4 methylase